MVLETGAIGAVGRIAATGAEADVGEMESTEFEIVNAELSVVSTTGAAIGSTTNSELSAEFEFADSSDGVFDCARSAKRSARRLRGSFPSCCSTFSPLESFRPSSAGVDFF